MVERPSGNQCFLARDPLRTKQYRFSMTVSDQPRKTLCARAKTITAMTIQDDVDFRELSESTAALFTAAGERSFFSRAEWYEVLLRHGLPAGTGGRLYLDAQPQCGVGLVCQVPPGASRRLRGLATPYSVEHAVLAADGADLHAGLGRIVETITREQPSWEAVTLSGFAGSDPGFRALVEELRQSGFSAEPFFDTGTWYEETAGASFADYLARRPSVLRNTWQRKSAKAARSNRVRWSFVDGGDGLDEAIAHYEAVYRVSWKKAEPFPEFMPALMRMAAALGALRLGLVHVDEAPAAAQLWIVWRGKACIYKLAHDERYKELSLGTLLTMRMAERVLERDKPGEINLGRGDDPYKKLWLSQRRESWGVMAVNPRTVRGLGLALRQAAKRAVQPWRKGQPVPPV
jgi:hypothetical protein